MEWYDSLLAKRDIKLTKAEKCCQRDVANRMADVARIWSPEFVMVRI